MTSLPTPAAGPVTARAARHGLRAATRTGHERLHRHPLLAGLLDGVTPPEVLAAALHGFLAFYRDLEPTLVEAARRSGLQTLYDRPIRTPWLEDDLRRLGEAAAAPRPAWFEAAAIDDPAVLAGVLYVVEGSASGGRLITRHLTPAWLPRRFFAGHGEGAAARWSTVRRFIAAACDTEERLAEATRAAGRTFRHVEAALDEQLGGARPR